MMFFLGEHKEVYKSIEAIGTAFAVYEFVDEANEFRLVSCNSLYEEISGVNRIEIIDKPIFNIFPRYIAKILQESFLKCKNKQVGLESEIFIEYKGTERWWRSIISPIAAVTNGKLRIIQTCVEITEKKVLEKHLNLTLSRFEAVVQSAYDGIITIDDSHNIKLINESALGIFGYCLDEVIGAPLIKLMPQKYRKHHSEYVHGFQESQVDSRVMETRAAVRGLRKDGSEFPIEVTISKIRVAGKIEMTAVIRDISEKNRLLEELLIASRVDALTKLNNRKYFDELFDAEISRIKRFKRDISLLMVDIDHFKDVNDTFGHDCGDYVLVNFSKHVTTLLRDTDVICRWGGEEFLILLPETNLTAATKVAEKLRKSVEKIAITFRNNDIQFTVSIGVSTFNEEPYNKEDMIHEVDQRLYKAKGAGRNQVCYEG